MRWRAAFASCWSEHPSRELASGMTATYTYDTRKYIIQHTLTTQLPSCPINGDGIPPHLFPQWLEQGIQHGQLLIRCDLVLAQQHPDRLKHVEAVVHHRRTSTLRADVPPRPAARNRDRTACASRWR